MRKAQSPKLSPSQFGPELVWTMRSVLDSAVDLIDAANRTPATKSEDGGTNSAGRIRWNHGPNDVDCCRG
jgi:hypothetical protein